jgi:HAE1 family hydrophobic/amphiphilic exporter-1
MDHFMEGLSRSYHAILVRCLNYRWTVIGASVAIFFGSLFLLSGVRKEFVPPQDQSQFLTTIYTPLGSSMEFTDGVFREAERILKERPEIENFYVAIGGFQGGLVNQGNMFVILKEPSERKFAPPFKHNPTQQEFMAWARDQFVHIKGVTKATVLDLSLQGFTAQRGFPITFAVQGPDWEKLAEYSEKMMDKMRKSGLMTDVDTDYNPNMPEVKILPNRWAAASRGVTITNIANSISTISDPKISRRFGFEIFKVRWFRFPML